MTAPRLLFVALAALSITASITACSDANKASSSNKTASSKPAAKPVAQQAVAQKVNAKVVFASPPDGATVFETVHVVFSVTGMSVSPAGQDAANKAKGHHHLIVDGAPIPAGTVVPKDATHLHFGKGQLETDIKLAPGKHTLTMQFADGNHISYGPSLSATIHVNVVKSPAKAPRVFFVGLKDGATVKSPLKLKFGIEGMKVRPAGQDVLDQTTGHHHLIVDDGPVAAGKVVGKDATHIHFGKGQTETELKLSPGKHKLTLQLADGSHKSYGEKLSSSLNVVVK